jgi:hypothetical protein
LTSAEIQQQLAIRLDTRFGDSGRKIQLLLVGQLIVVFALAFVLMGRVWGRGLSPAPLLIPIALNAIWAIFIALAHHWTLIYKNRQEIHQESDLLLYNSMWVRFWQGGLGLLTSGVIIWGAIELWITRGNASNFVPIILLLSWIVVLALGFIRRDWIAKVVVEGRPVHRRTWKLITIFGGVLFVSPVLSGVGRMMQVSIGKEITMLLLLGPFIVIIWVLAVSITILSIIVSNDNKKYTAATIRNAQKI